MSFRFTGLDQRPVDWELPEGAPSWPAGIAWTACLKKVLSLQGRQVWGTNAGWVEFRTGTRPWKGVPEGLSGLSGCRGGDCDDEGLDAGQEGSLPNRQCVESVG